MTWVGPPDRRRTSMRFSADLASLSQGVDAYPHDRVRSATGDRTFLAIANELDVGIMLFGTPLRREAPMPSWFFDFALFYETLHLERDTSTSESFSRWKRVVQVLITDNEQRAAWKTICQLGADWFVKKRFLDDIVARVGAL